MTRTALVAIAMLALASFIHACVDKAADRAYQRGDYDAAARKLQPLAEGGEVRAQYDLALLYDKGLGVPQDDAKALYWYKRAAEHGETRAQYNLALMYMNGQGIQPDYIRSYYWFSMAASQGHLAAPGAREYLIEKMTREQIAEGQKLVDVRLRTGQLPVFQNLSHESP
jgi:TPR repeat protein